MALNSASVKVIVFDLDDTLFDTLGQLVKPATKETCQAMISAGLNASLDDCIQQRNEIFKNNPRDNIYRLLVNHFGTNDNENTDSIVTAGFEAFHNRKVEEEITPFEHTHQTLQSLKANYPLFLVTLGNPPTQQKKVKRLGLEEFFEKIFYVDVAQSHSKKEAFQTIMNQYDLTPDSFLCIGNRIDTELKDGKTLGMQTILMKHGEYLHLESQCLEEVPDAEIENVETLLSILL